jgi:hypothetical protein
MKPFIPITVTLGSPNADCANFGVCSVVPLTPEAWAAYRPLHLRAAKAEIAPDDDGRLVFHFPKDGVLLLARRHFFTPRGFQIDAPKTLPEAMATRLGFESCVILPGLYPVQEQKDGTLIVEVALKSQRVSPNLGGVSC